MSTIDKSPAMVLVGFGKTELKDVVNKIGTQDENDLLRAPLRSPPRYRREEICNHEEIEAFVTYCNFLQQKIKLGEI